MPKKYAAWRERSRLAIRQPQPPSLGSPTLFVLPSAVETADPPPLLTTDTELEPPWTMAPPLDRLLPPALTKPPPVVLPPVILPAAALPPVA